MKKYFIILGFFLLATTFLVTSTGDSPLMALSGCCKERTSYKAPWRYTKMSFTDCEERNKRRDNDYVFDRKGFVWWDKRCR
jgi:hypothetical protein